MEASIHAGGIRGVSAIRSGGGIGAPSLKQYKDLMYGREFVLTLKRYPRGEI